MEVRLMECFIQQVFSRHLLFAKQEEYNQESLSGTLGKVLENRMEQQLVILALIRPTHTVLLNRGHGVITLLPTSLTPTYLYTLDAPICLSFSLSPSLLLFLSLLLCLIKKHLLAIHCISEQNLYFRHVEP